MTKKPAPKKHSAIKQKRLRKSSDADLKTGSSAPTAEFPRSLESSIGAEVRRLRKSLDLTVADLGATSGFSAGMVSKIENGAISPSLGTLKALAQALNVPISRFFSENEERRDCSFVKKGSGLRIKRRGTKAGHLYDLLGQTMSDEIAVEPYLISLQKDAVPYIQFRHVGVEIIYMLSGKVRYRHADQSYVMEPGDTLCFDATARHGPEELIESPMQYLSIIMYPKQA